MIFIGLLLNKGYICGDAGEAACRPIKGRKDMVKVGDVCPLFFNPPGKYEFGTGCYVQKFHSSDVILLQVLADGGEAVSGTLNDKVSGGSSPISFSTYEQNDDVKVYYKSFTSLDNGVYSVTVDGIGESEEFEVDSSDFLKERTALFRYSHKDNNSFDDIFWIDGTQQFFCLRVEGGFKPGGFLPQVEVEQYRNQRQEIEELYSMPYEQWQLTIGDGGGVPVWFLALVNRLFSLSHVEVNGKLYVRSETSSPTPVQLSEDSRLFQAVMTVEPRENPVSGMGGTPEAASGGSVVGFAIENAKDGQMLQYKEEKSAFVNVTTVEV